MLYLVEWSDKFKKQYKKLDNNLKIAILKKLNRLKYNPEISKNKRGDFYEIYCKGYRVYYKIFKKKITVENIKYKGKVKVERLGNKNSQKRDINKL